MAFLGGLLGGGGSDPADIYGDLFTEKQRAALRDQQLTDTLLRLSAGFAKAGQASRLPTGGLLGALGEAAGGLAGSGDEATNRMLKGMQIAEQVRKSQQERAFGAQFMPLLQQAYAEEQRRGLPQGTLTKPLLAAAQQAPPGPGGPPASNAPPPPPAYQNPDMGDVPARPLVAPTATDAGDYLPGKGAGLLDPAAYGSSGGGLPGQGILPQFASLYGGGTGSQFPFDPTTSDLTGPQGSPDRRIQIEQLSGEALPVDAPFPTVANPNKPASAWQQGIRYNRGDTPFDPARPYATPQQFAEPPSELDRLSQLMKVETTAKPSAAPNLTGSNWEIANNNFGGMRRPGVNASPSQGGFQTFATPEAGLGAISHQLDRYASGATTGKPLSTIREIVSTWAPPSENDTETLIKRASRVMGVADNIPLNLSDPAVKAKLIEATVRNEQGGNLPVDSNLIARVAGAPPGTYAASSGGGGGPRNIRVEPLGSDAVPAGAAPSGKIPGINTTPEGLAILNSMAKLSGFGSPFDSLLETYYKSPAYLEEKTRTETKARTDVEDPLNRRMKVLEFNLQMRKDGFIVGDDGKVTEDPAWAAVHQRRTDETEGLKQKYQEKQKTFEEQITIEQEKRADQREIVQAQVMGDDGKTYIKEMPRSDKVKQLLNQSMQRSGEYKPGDIVATPYRTPEAVKGAEKSSELGVAAGWKALEDSHAREIDANRRLQSYGQVAEAMQGFRTGATAEQRLYWKGVLRDAGVIEGTDVPDGEVAQRAMRRLQLDAASVTKGSTSDYERSLIAQGAMQLGNTPEAVIKMIDQMRRLDEYDQKIAQIHREVAEKNQGVPNVIEAQRRIAALGPPLSPGEVKALERVREGQVPGGGNAAKPANEIIQNGWRYDATTHQALGPVQ